MTNKIKLGRNSICPCGSGKKYKNCCLQNNNVLYNQQPTYYFVNYHIPVFTEMFNRMGSNTNLLRYQLTDTHVRNFFSLLAPPSTFPSLISIDILEKWRNSLENLMKNIISKHHVYYWLHLYRRLAPENVFGYASNVSTFLVRNILETSFLKYGDLNESKIEQEMLHGDDIDINQIMSGEYVKVIQNILDKRIEESISGCYIKDFNLSDFIEILSIEVLASEYHSVTANIRRVNKGGELEVVSDDYYFVKNTDDDNHLISSFDKRNELYGGDVSSRGLPLELMKIEKGAKGFIMIPVYNVRRVTFKDYPFHKIWKISFVDIEQFSPNFIWIPLDLNKFYLMNYFIKDSFLLYYGFSLESFLNCIIGLYLYISISLKRDPLRNGDLFMQRAYQLFESKSFLADSIYNLLKNESYFLGEQIPTVLEILKVLDTFTLTIEKQKNIDLTTMGPRYFIINTFSESIIVDYAALMSALMTTTHFINANESKKGKVFEDFVEEELKKQNFLKWKKGHLRGFDGTIIEIDASFINRNVMFLCELKCINRSFAFEKGDADAIKFRCNKFEDALSKCDKKAEWLSRQKKGFNYYIPDDVVAIVPVVVSPFVEYIWSRNDYYWLTEEIPRVCIYEELQKLNTPDILKTVIEKSFVKYIH